MQKSHPANSLHDFNLHHLYWQVINKVSYVTLYGSLLYKRLSPYRQLYKTDISLNWTPGVGPCLSLLRLVDSLEDGHLSKKGHLVLVAKVSITDRVNCKHFELENGVMMTLKHRWIYHWFFNWLCVMIPLLLTFCVPFWNIFLVTRQYVCSANSPSMYNNKTPKGHNGGTSVCRCTRQFATSRGRTLR